MIFFIIAFDVVVNVDIVEDQRERYNKGVKEINRVVYIDANDFVSHLDLFVDANVYVNLIISKLNRA